MPKDQPLERNCQGAFLAVPLVEQTAIFSTIISCWARYHRLHRFTHGRLIEARRLLEGLDAGHLGIIPVLSA